METIFARIVALVFSWQGLLIIALVLMTWKSEETLRFFGKLRALVWGVSNPTAQSPAEAGFAMTRAVDRHFDIVNRGDQVLSNLVVILVSKREQQKREAASLREQAEILGEFLPVSQGIALSQANATLEILQEKEQEAKDLLSAYRVASQAREQGVVLVEVLGKALLTMGDIDVPVALQQNAQELRKALSSGDIHSPIGWSVKSPELDGYLKVVQQKQRQLGDGRNGGER